MSLLNSKQFSPSLNLSGSFTGSFTGSFKGSAVITGSLVVTGSITLAGGSRLTNEYDYPSIDIQAGAGGYVELLSNNQSSSLILTNQNVVIATSGGAWIFGENGTTSYPANVIAASFTGSLQGTASYATTSSYAMNGGGGNQYTELVSLDASDFNITTPGAYLLSDTQNGYAVNFPIPFSSVGYSITIVNPNADVVQLGASNRPYGLENEIISNLAAYSTNTFTSVGDAGWFLTGRYNY